MYNLNVKKCVIFNFLPVINNSITIGLSFLLLSISAIISSNKIRFFCFYLGYNLQYFYKYQPYYLNIQFRKRLRIIKCFVPTSSRFLIQNWYFASFISLTYKSILSISDCWFIKLNNEFVSPDPVPPIINILYGWSGISGQFGLSFFVSFFIASSKLINFCIVLCVSLLNPCCIFNIDLFFFYKFFMISYICHFFSIWFILFSSWVASKQLL